jgi:predicted short-subunit dehydrogenase-like oxidoreductase (DUF2520 family)
MQVYKIVMLGAGNLGTHLALHIEQAGHRVVKVYSRHLVNATLLCKKLYEAQATDTLNFLDTEADLFLLCVSDNAIAPLLQQLQLPPTATLAHTAGMQPLQLLAANKANTPNIAVFYPLQTFSKGKEVDFSTIPICIEANNQLTLDFIGELATALSQEVYLLDTPQRQTLHLAAVLACNFTNHLFALAHNILQDKDLDFEMLFPLITETVQKAMLMPPKDAQTGAAKRGDTQTIAKHLAMLEAYPSYQKIYQVLSESIQAAYAPK